MVGSAVIARELTAGCFGLQNLGPAKGHASRGLARRDLCFGNGACSASAIVKGRHVITQVREELVRM